MHQIYLYTSLPVIAFLAYFMGRSSTLTLIVKFLLIVLTGFGILVLLKDLHVL